MAKKKKGKVVGMQSPENFIKTRARTLPITDCYINDNWKDVNFANIVIARSHVTGNRTFGLFLVDLNCLGVKDAAYYFNETESEFNTFLKRYSFAGTERCDYNLAHNIIYSALEFADDYGFKPHSDWKIAQYILEEDNDEIALVDIDLGMDGRPLYIQGPYESDADAERIINTLKRTAGEGNFDFILGGDEDPDDDYDFGYEDDEDEWDDDGREDEDIFRPGDIERILHNGQLPNPAQNFLLTLAQYRLARREEPFISTQELNKGVDITENDWQLEKYFPDLEKGIQKMKALVEALKYPAEEQLGELEKVVQKYGESPQSYLTKYQLIADSDPQSAAEIVKIMSEKYPDYLQFRFTHALRLVLERNYEEAWKQLGETETITQSFPERNGKFTSDEWTEYNLAMSTYYMATKRVHMAASYAAEIATQHKSNLMIATQLLVLTEIMLKDLEADE